MPNLSYTQLRQMSFLEICDLIDEEQELRIQIHRKKLELIYERTHSDVECSGD